MTNEKDARKALTDLLKAIDQIATPPEPGDDGAYWAHGGIPGDVMKEAQEAARIAVVDMEYSQYLGVEDCGMYFGAGEGWDGWYVSTAYDVGHDCGDATEDEGPYPTEGDAMLAGLEHAAQMMFDNDVVRGWRNDYRRLYRVYKAMAKKG